MSENVSLFEHIRQVNEYGSEYWSGRALAQALGYADWRNFVNAINKALLACVKSGEDPTDHFAEVIRETHSGRGRTQPQPDFYLSRYACYLVVQNGDPDKELIALGQTYFAVQTRRAEISIAERLGEMSDDQRRLYMRSQVAEHHKQLAAAAADAGVTTPREFAEFNARGLQGLYGGLTAREIRIMRGLPANANLYDWMGYEELGDNLFRQIQAEARLRREGIHGREAANRVHFEVGQQVRRFILEELHGTPPELLPTPAESIQRVEQREAQRLLRQGERERQPSLFEIGALDTPAHE